MEGARHDLVAKRPILNYTTDKRTNEKEAKRE
jgi:hypothetical protein